MSPLKLRIPQRKRPCMRHGSSLSPVRTNSGTSTPRKKDSSIIPTPRTSHASIEGSSHENPIVIEADDSGEEEGYPKQPHISHVRPAQKCAHYISTKGSTSKADLNGQKQGVSTKRRRTTACEHETPTKRHRQDAAQVEATLEPNHAGDDTDEDAELIVYDSGRLFRFEHLKVTDVPGRDSSVANSRETSRTLSAEPREMNISPARLHEFERTFRAVIFADIASVRHVMQAVNAWVNKAAGGWPFNLKETRAALDVLDSRKVIQLSGETVFFPEDLPLSTKQDEGS